MFVACAARTAATWVSTADSQSFQLTHWYGKFGYQSGIRTMTFAPARAAFAATTRESPAGAGSPLGSCLPPGAICTNVLGCNGSTYMSAGVVSLARPYRPPDATWVTARRF